MGRLPLVNLLQGTDSHHDFSRGNTLPLIARPFGMNHWSLQTREGRWLFSPHDRKLQGIRCTHQPSPWIGDYGAFCLLPQTGPIRTSPFHRATAYRLDQATLSPACFECELVRDGILVKFAPTERAAILEVVFPDVDSARLIVHTIEGPSRLELANDGRSVRGWTAGHSGGAPEGFRHYFWLELNHAATAAQVFSANDANEGQAILADRAGMALEFGQLGGPLVVRIGTSFLSVDQARRNLELEVGERGYAEIRAQNEATWEAELAKIEVEGGTEVQQRTFYSCLYRTQLFPRALHELTESGLRHYSPYDGQVHEGVLYTDNGFWDTYRTEYPLLSLINPKRHAEILQGWVNAYREGGWFPQWASPGYRACMVGTHIDAVFADALARGVTDFDVEGAFEGMWKHAFEVGDEAGAYGRIGIRDYLEFGFVSAEHHESVARTLDYAYDDWCIAQVARFLGRTAEAEKLEARVGNYRHLYDPGVGFFRARHRDGSWEEPFSPWRWGSPYVEGGPWQTLFAVPHDLPGLFELLGGEAQALERLTQLVSLPPRYEIGVYGFEIHEMVEMAAAEFGQYAHSNQPVHHNLWLFQELGRPDLTRHWVHRVLNELYSPDHLPGDEDNGEMCAWYVLASMGMFPLCPGRPGWVHTVPLFDRVRILSEG